MSEPGRKRLPPEVWEFLAASAILAWRIRLYSPATLWRDWVVILALFWIVTILAGRSRAWPWLMGAFMIGLLVLYTSRQLPLTLEVLGSLR